MGVQRCCCTGPSDASCCDDQTSCTLASSYSVSFNISATTNTSAGSPQYDSCGNNYTIGITPASALTATLGGISGCGQCFREQRPPFTGPAIRRVYHYGGVSTTQPNWGLIATSSGSSSCGSLNDCTNYISTSEAGTTSASNCVTGGCAFGLSCINEINTTYAVNIWYWIIRYKFVSTATVSNGSLGGNVPEVEAGFNVRSTAQASCHAPTNLTWEVAGESTVRNSSWYTGEAMCTYVVTRTAHPDGTSPALICWRPAGAFAGVGVKVPDSTVSSLSVSVT